MEINSIKKWILLTQNSSCGLPSFYITSSMSYAYHRYRWFNRTVSWGSPSFYITSSMSYAYYRSTDGLMNILLIHSHQGTLIQFSYSYLTANSMLFKFFLLYQKKFHHYNIARFLSTKNIVFN